MITSDNMSSTLSIQDIQIEVRKHYHDDKTYLKEMNESENVFKKLADITPCHVLSLACGSTVGAELFSTYFTHPDSRLHGIDIELRQTTSFLLKYQYLHSFIQEDLYLTEPSAAALLLFKTCQKWMAIHACRKLANRIVYLFRLYASPGSELATLPCCLLRQAEYKQLVGLQRWKEMRTLTQNASKIAGTDWRLELAIESRNELLIREYPDAFCGITRLEEIPSIHNQCLIYKKL